jgi:peptide/nickel transport system substrate-binding protein
MKMTMTRALAMLLSLILVFSASSCGGSESAPNENTGNSSGSSDDSPAGDTGGAPPVSSPDAPAKDTLRVAVSGDNGTLDPVGMGGSGGFLNIALTYMEPLWDTNGDMERVYVLAEGLDAVSPTQYTIHLREGVTFSNGNPFTADDVIFTFNLYKNNPNRSFYLQAVDMDNTKKIDEYTVDLRFAYPHVAQIGMMTQTLIVDAESYDAADFAVHPIGTGPYRVTEYIVGSHTNVEARADHWNGEPAIRHIEFKVLNEDSQKVTALETGTVDVAGVPTQDIVFVKDLPGYVVHEAPSILCGDIGFNMSENSVFASRDARLAVIHAIDKQAIINLAYSGYGYPAEYPFTKHMIDWEDRFAYMGEAYKDSYNVELAREYAESAGIVGATVRIITNGSSEYVTTAEILQAQLKEVGINAEINNYDAASYFEVAFDTTMFDISVYCTATPALMIADIIWTTIAFSDSGWAGPEYDRFMELGAPLMGIDDAQERSGIIYEMLKIWTDVNPTYGTVETIGATAVARDIQGVEFWSIGDVRYQDWSFA